MKKIRYDEVLEYFMCIATIGSIGYGLFCKNYIYSLNALLTLGVVITPRIIMKKLEIEATSLLKFLIQFFIFVSMFLGRLNGFYGKVSNWDTFLHTLSGFIIFLVAYVIFIVQNGYEIKNVNPTLVVTYCVLFAVAMTAIWEMWEFAGDKLLGLNSQGGSLIDTMKDIITGSIGPIVLFPFLLSHLKGKKNKLLDDLVDTVIRRKVLKNKNDK